MFVQSPARCRLRHDVFASDRRFSCAGVAAKVARYEKEMVAVLGRPENSGNLQAIAAELSELRARIAQLCGFSGHADKDGLEAWLRAFDEKPKFVFVNHGEDAVAEHWANHLKEEGYEADAPYNGSIWIAAEGRVACAEVGNTRKIIKTKSAETVRTSAAYDRLANMGQRLLEVIRHNRGGANKDLAKFAGQIAALCDKWDR